MAQNLRGDGYAVLLDMGKLNIPFQASGMVTTRKMLRTNTRPIEGVARATLDSINFIRNPGNKRSVLQIITRNLRLANFARAEPAYNQLVEELPRNICPTLTGVRTIVKLMAELGINAKAAQIKSDDVVDVGLCKRLGGEAK